MDISIKINYCWKILDWNAKFSHESIDIYFVSNVNSPLSVHMQSIQRWIIQITVEQFFEISAFKVFKNMLLDLIKSGTHKKNTYSV